MVFYQLISLYVQQKVTNVLFSRVKVLSKSKHIQMLILFCAFFLYLHAYYYVMIDTEPTFYDHFEVSKHASMGDIKKAYRHVAKKYHPDRNPQYEKYYMDLQEMYYALKDSDSRWMYDRFNLKLKHFRGTQ